MPMDARHVAGGGFPHRSAGASPTALHRVPYPRPGDSVRAQSQNVALPGVVVWWRPGAQAQADLSQLDVCRLYLQRRIIDIG